MLGLSLPIVLTLGLVVVANLVAWAAFRVDKARARRGARRISERRLLTLAAFGGPGALAAMYLHRRRHKVDKARFAATVWTLTFAQLGLAVAVLVWLG